VKSRTRLVTLLTSLVLIITLWSLGRLAQAADISHEVRQGAVQSAPFLELGLRLGAERVPIVGLAGDKDDPTNTSAGIEVLLNGMFEWRGFFGEVIVESFGGLTFGYRLHQSDSRNFEIVFSNTLPDLTPDTAGFESIEDRDADLVAGFRSSFYFPKSIVQLSLLGDVSDRHGGFTAAAQWGRFWQVRNWNLHAIAGARFFSENLTDFYFGIRPDEVSELTPLYTAGSGLMTELEFGATLPLSQDWIFRSSVQFFRLPDAIVDSPLTLGRSAYVFSNSINYVF